MAEITGPVLGIETSCDETAAAVLAPDGSVLAEAVLSQQEHAVFGGVVPEIAARAHLLHLPGLVADVMARAGAGFSDLGGVAATSGPGLIGGLIVGSGFAKGVALAHGKKFVAVNHLEAHALTARLPGLVAGGLPFPYLLLLVSGGHCQCVAVEGVGRYARLGGTIDDAVGEAFDKVAKLLGLGWPGGPALERLAASGDPRRHALPRPLLGRPGCDFSFSGLKTAVAQLVATYPPGPLPVQVAADIAAGFQRAVADVMADRAGHAMAAFAERAENSRLPLWEGVGGGVEPPDFPTFPPPAPTLPHKGGGRSYLVVAGGVAANAALRAALAAAARRGFSLIAPPIKLCGDNATMVAWAGIERLRLGLADPLDHAPRPRWPLSELAA